MIYIDVDRESGKLKLILAQLSLDGHGRTPQGVGGVKIDFRKISFLSVSPRNFFEVSRGFSEGQKRDSVNLAFNAFLHRNFSSRYIMDPRGGS